MFEALEQLAVERLAPVEHRDERQDRRCIEPVADRNPVSWPSVRADSVAGIVGTSSASAAPNTLSLASEMPGGQSRIARS